MNKKQVLIFLIFFILFCGLSRANNTLVSKDAPFFKVYSGSDDLMTLDMVKGKVVILLYETKEVIEKNRQFKIELNKFCNEQGYLRNGSLSILPIINCSKTWPFTNIWKKELIENSNKEKITLYGDWDGKMFKDYQIVSNDSNIIIIDKKGEIQYVTFGTVDKAQIDEIKKLLIKLLE